MLTHIKYIFLFKGKLKDEEEVLEWLIDPSTMTVSDVIEKINDKMFEKVLRKFEYVAVFFCKYTYLSKHHFATYLLN